MRFTSRGRPFRYGLWDRQISNWTGRRIDRHEWVRGVLTLDLLNDASTGTYADEAFTRVGPAAVWRRWARTLLFVQNHIVYKPFG